MSAQKSTAAGRGRRRLLRKLPSPKLQRPRKGRRQIPRLTPAGRRQMATQGGEDPCEAARRVSCAWQLLAAQRPRRDREAWRARSRIELSWLPVLCQCFLGPGFCGLLLSGVCAFAIMPVLLLAAFAGAPRGCAATIPVVAMTTTRLAGGKQILMFFSAFAGDKSDGGKARES